jgi:hypothetical protein
VKEHNWGIKLFSLFLLPPCHKLYNFATHPTSDILSHQRSPKIKATQTWSETYGTVSQSKSFFSISELSQLFCQSNGKLIQKIEITSAIWLFLMIWFRSFCNQFMGVDWKSLEMEDREILECWKWNLMVIMVGGSQDHSAVSEIMLMWFQIQMKS